jgi:hypothetical protein
MQHTVNGPRVGRASRGIVVPELSLQDLARGQEAAGIGHGGLISIRHASSGAASTGATYRVVAAQRAIVGAGLGGAGQGTGGQEGRSGKDSAGRDHGDMGASSINSEVL